MATVSPPRSSVFNLPNQLTTARFVLALVLFGLIAWENWLACLVVFTIAMITDWLDGYLARLQGLTSTLGRNLDPLVDKVLICGAYIFLLPFGMSQAWIWAADPSLRPLAQASATNNVALAAYMYPWLQPWMVTLIVARELIITGLRSFMENRGATFGADWLGKVKMVLQCAALVSIFVSLYVLVQYKSAAANQFFGYTRVALIWAMLLATALSGLQYLWRAALLLKADNYG